MYKQILNYLNEDKMLDIKLEELSNTKLKELLVKVNAEIDIRSIRDKAPFLPKKDNMSENKGLHVIMMDINALPYIYKEDGGLEQYEKDYNVKIIPYDISRSNLGGSINVGIQYLGRE